MPALALAAAILAGVAAPPARIPIGVCHGRHRVTCVVDGDTFWWRGEKIRLADIDAPEIEEPECAAEHALGLEAQQRLAALIGDRPIAIRRTGTDRYGRTLALVSVGGRDLGLTLMAEGLPITGSASAAVGIRTSSLARDFAIRLARLGRSNPDYR